MSSSVQLGKVKWVTQVGHSAVVRIAAQSAGLPQLAGRCLLQWAQRQQHSLPHTHMGTGPEFGPSYKAVTHDFLNTLQGDDNAFLWAVTGCSHKLEQMEDQLLGQHIISFMPGGPTTVSCCLLVVLVHTTSQWLTSIKHLLVLSFVYPEEEWVKDYSLNFFCKLYKILEQKSSFYL